jgi:choline-sulfatase
VGARPNILLFVADQLSARYLSAYGHTVTKTPTLERLAAEAVVFDRAYSPSPICAPARSVLMSGQLPSRTGAYDNGAEFPASVPTFAHYLRRQGYRTCLTGKMHFVGPDQLHGFEERLTTDIYPADFGWTPDWSSGGERVDWWYHNMSSVGEAGVAEITNQLEYDDEVAFTAVRRIYDHARDAEEAPLCLCVSFTHPHDPYVARQRHWDVYRDAEIDLPAVPPIEYASLDPHSRRLWDAAAMGGVEIGEEDVRAARHGYYASLSYVDEKIREVLAAVEACGLAESTITLFTSDHGDFLGERGLWYKMSFLEPAAHVPLFVHAPWRFGARRIAAPVSLADIAPTLVELAVDGTAGQLAAPVDGRSLAPALEGADDDADTTVAGEYLAEAIDAPMFMLLRRNWKFIQSEGDPDQLFDLDSDPLELENLAERAEHAETVAAFRAETQRRWDAAALREAVVASQQARLAVFEALGQGAPFPWDFQPLRNASSRYTRSGADVTSQDRRSRFPPSPSGRA